MASMALDNEGLKTNVEKHPEGVINLPATNNNTTNNFNDNNNNNNIKSKSDIDIQANNSIVKYYCVLSVREAMIRSLH